MSDSSQLGGVVGSNFASDHASTESVAKAVQISGLSKSYETRGGSVLALDNTTFDVGSGEFVSLVGPSGCGKSTLLHIVAGLLDFEAGAVNVLGTPARAGRRDVGIMLQKAVLFPWRTALENVLLPGEVFGGEHQISRDAATGILASVGLDGFQDKYPWELSGGMQQRVSLARLLAFEPRLLLMDEPFAALDEFTRERLNLELARLHESQPNRSTIYVTHNIAEAVFLSDRVVTMRPRPGQVVAIEEITMERPRNSSDLSSDAAIEHVRRIRSLLHVDEEPM